MNPNKYVKPTLLYRKYEYHPLWDSHNKLYVKYIMYKGASSLMSNLVMYLSYSLVDDS